MSQPEFDIRAILKPGTPIASATTEQSVQRHEMVVEGRRLLFAALGLIILCGAFFWGGYWVGMRRSEAPVTKPTTAESTESAPFDGMVAAVPTEEGGSAKANGTRQDSDAPGARPAQDP